jgi:hypothetical protein
MKINKNTKARAKYFILMAIMIASMIITSVVALAGPSDRG